MKIQLDAEQSKKLEEIKQKKKEVFDNTSKERLLEIAHTMHTWIFLHSSDEQEIYDELGLTDEKKKKKKENKNGQQTRTIRENISHRR